MQYTNFGVQWCRYLAQYTCSYYFSKSGSFLGRGGEGTCSTQTLAYSNAVVIGVSNLIVIIFQSQRYFGGGEGRGGMQYTNVGLQWCSYRRRLAPLHIQPLSIPSSTCRSGPGSCERTQRWPASGVRRRCLRSPSRGLLERMLPSPWRGSQSSWLLLTPVDEIMGENV